MSKKSAATTSNETSNSSTSRRNGGDEPEKTASTTKSKAHTEEKVSKGKKPEAPKPPTNANSASTSASSTASTATTTTTSQQPAQVESDKSESSSKKRKLEVSDAPPSSNTRSNKTRKAESGAPIMLDFMDTDGVMDLVKLFGSDESDNEQPQTTSKAKKTDKKSNGETSEKDKEDDGDVAIVFARGQNDSTNASPKRVPDKDQSTTTDAAFRKVTELAALLRERSAPPSPTNAVSTKPDGANTNVSTAGAKTSPTTNSAQSGTDTKPVTSGANAAGTPNIAAPTTVRLSPRLTVTCVQAITPPAPTPAPAPTQPTVAPNFVHTHAAGESTAATNQRVSHTVQGTPSNLLYQQQRLQQQQLLQHQVAHQLALRMPQQHPQLQQPHQVSSMATVPSRQTQPTVNGVAASSNTAIAAATPAANTYPPQKRESLAERINLAFGMIKDMGASLDNEIEFIMGVKKQVHIVKTILKIVHENRVIPLFSDLVKVYSPQNNGSGTCKFDLKPLTSLDESMKCSLKHLDELLAAVKNRMLSTFDEDYNTGITP